VNLSWLAFGCFAHFFVSEYPSFFGSTKQAEMSEIASYPFSVWHSKAPQQPSSNGGLACRVDAFSMKDKHVHKPLGIAGLNSVKMKRGHVSKACINCRKMHAGCDIQRPCSRCVFHKMESTCVDIPRKKRMSRKKKGEDSLDDSPPEFTSIVVEAKKEEQPGVAPSEKLWKDTFNEIFDEINGNPPTPSSVPSTNPFTPQQQSFMFTDLLNPDTDTDPSNSSKGFQTSDFFNLDNTCSSSSSLFDSPKKDFQEMKQQMEDLRHSNVLLESKLNNVTQELTEMRQKMQQLLQLLGGFFVQTAASPQNTSTNHDV